jgi:hypothetical protein
MGRLVISVSQNAVLQAELAIQACASCSPDAKTPFWKVFDSFRTYPAFQVTYILPVLGRCPACRAPLAETTLVLPKPRGT